MKTLSKILLTGMILGSGSLETIKAQEGEPSYSQTMKLDDEFICDAWVAHDTDISKAISLSDDIFVPSISQQIDVKRLLKENSDSAVCNLRYNRNFYNWFVRNAEPIFNYSGCNLKTFSLSQPLDNFRIYCGVKDKARPLQKEEFLGTIISLLSKQKHGEKGVLSIKEPNVFYVRLNNKRIVSVSAGYNPAGNSKAWDIQTYTMVSYGPKYKIFFAEN